MVVVVNKPKLPILCLLNAFAVTSLNNRMSDQVMAIMHDVYDDIT
jgi:hypothetical protein